MDLPTSFNASQDRNIEEDSRQESSDQRMSRQESSGQRMSRQESSGQRMSRQESSGQRMSRQESTGQRMGQQESSSQTRISHPESSGQGMNPVKPRGRKTSLQASAERKSSERHSSQDSSHLSLCSPCTTQSSQSQSSLDVSSDDELPFDADLQGHLDKDRFEFNIEGDPRNLSTWRKLTGGEDENVLKSLNKHGAACLSPSSIFPYREERLELIEEVERWFMKFQRLLQDEDSYGELKAAKVRCDGREFIDGITEDFIPFDSSAETLYNASKQLPPLGMQMLESLRKLIAAYSSKIKDDPQRPKYIEVLEVDQLKEDADAWETGVFSLMELFDSIRSTPSKIPSQRKLDFMQVARHGKDLLKNLAKVYDNQCQKLKGDSEDLILQKWDDYTEEIVVKEKALKREHDQAQCLADVRIPRVERSIDTATAACNTLETELSQTQREVTQILLSRDEGNQRIVNLLEDLSKHKATEATIKQEIKRLEDYSTILEARRSSSPSPEKPVRATDSSDKKKKLHFHTRVPSEERSVVIGGTSDRPVRTVMLTTVRYFESNSSSSSEDTEDSEKRPNKQTVHAPSGKEEVSQDTVAVRKVDSVTKQDTDVHRMRSSKEVVSQTIGSEKDVTAAKRKKSTQKRKRSHSVGRKSHSKKKEWLPVIVNEKTPEGVIKGIIKPVKSLVFADSKPKIGVGRIFSEQSFMGPQATATQIQSEKEEMKKAERQFSNLERLGSKEVHMALGGPMEVHPGSPHSSHVEQDESIPVVQKLSKPVSTKHKAHIAVDETKEGFKSDTPSYASLETSVTTQQRDRTEKTAQVKAKDETGGHVLPGLVGEAEGAGSLTLETPMDVFIDDVSRPSIQQLKIPLTPQKVEHVEEKSGEKTKEVRNVIRKALLAAAQQKGVESGIRNFMDLRKAIAAELKTKEMPSHARVLGNICDCDLKDGERIEDILTKVQIQVGPIPKSSRTLRSSSSRRLEVPRRRLKSAVFCDFEDVISNAIRELKRTEEAQKMDSKAQLLHPVPGMPTGLEAWNQANDKFKAKEREYAELLDRYSTLWQIYNRMRTDLLEAWNKKVAPQVFNTILEEEETEEEEEILADAMPQATCLLSPTSTDERKGELHKTWKDDLQFTKDALDEKAISHQEYMEQVNLHLQMAAILQYKLQMLGNTYSEIRIRKALAAKINDILNEVGMKRKELLSHLKKTGLDHFGKEIEGLNEVEKSIRIHQTQILLTLSIEESHARVRQKLQRQMIRNHMDIIREDEEPTSSSSSSTNFAASTSTSTSSSPSAYPLQPVRSKRSFIPSLANVEEGMHEDETPEKRDEHKGEKSGRPHVLRIGVENPSHTMHTSLPQLLVHEAEPGKVSSAADEDLDVEEFKICVNRSRADLLRNISLGLEQDAFSSGPPSLDMTDHPSRYLVPPMLTLSGSSGNLHILDSVSEMTVDAIDADVNSLPQSYYPHITPLKSPPYRADKDSSVLRRRVSLVKPHGMSLLPEEPKALLSVLGESLSESKRTSSRRGKRGAEKRMSVLPFLTGTGPFVHCTSYVSHRQSARGSGMLMLGMDSVVAPVAGADNVNVCLHTQAALPTRPHWEENSPRVSHPSHPPDLRAYQKFRSPAPLDHLCPHTAPCSPRQSPSPPTPVKTRQAEALSTKQPSLKYGQCRRTTARQSPVSKTSETGGVSDLPGLKRGSLLSTIPPGQSYIHIADVTADLYAKEEHKRAAEERWFRSASSPRLNLPSPRSITPRGNRPLSGDDLREYLDTLPSPRDPVPQREQRPFIHDKLKTLHRQYDEASKLLAPRPPTGEVVFRVKDWVDARKVPDTPRTLPTLHRSGDSLTHERKKQTRSVRRVLLKHKRRLRDFSPTLSTAELAPPRTPSVVMPLEDGFQKWSAARAVRRDKIIDSKLYCLDINQILRKAQRAMHQITDAYPDKVATDPSCVHIWNKFQAPCNRQ